MDGMTTADSAKTWDKHERWRHYLIRPDELVIQLRDVDKSSAAHHLVNTYVISEKW